MSTKRIENARKYLQALEEYSLFFADHDELIAAGLLDAETFMPTAKAHAFIDNTHNNKRWMKVKSKATSLEKAVLLADQYAREDLGLI
ncbi:hypothetical protein [Paenibacillus sp. GXUN7292]|uniref:hypothetical protein n=1 Tax=Paenibacillus sp. GXUN7292 TaxID=3422499 RepID=UPI003D7E0BC4